MSKKNKIIISLVVLLIIGLVITLVVINNNDINNKKTDNVQTEEVITAGAVEVKTTDELKTIFDGNALILICVPELDIDATEVKMLTELANEYQVKLYLVSKYMFIKYADDTNTQYVLDKIATNVEGYSKTDIITPDFYEIVGGKIYTRLVGLNTTKDITTLTDDDKNTLKDEYRLSFERAKELAQ